MAAVSSNVLNISKKLRDFSHIPGGTDFHCYNIQEYCKKLTRLAVDLRL
jgi:hypothetical protein